MARLCSSMLNRPISDPLNVGIVKLTSSTLDGNVNLEKMEIFSCFLVGPQNTPRLLVISDIVQDL